MNLQSRYDRRGGKRRVLMTGTRQVLFIQGAGAGRA